MKTTKILAALVAGALGGTLTTAAIAEVPASGETVTVRAGARSFTIRVRSAVSPVFRFPRNCSCR